MSWSIGHDSRTNRWIGYGVPAYCDHPGCYRWIDRGLAHVCAKEEPRGGELGCGLYFCAEHLVYHEGKDDDSSGFMCERCDEFHTRIAKKRCKDFDLKSFTPTPERPDWIKHLLKDESWDDWREENPKEVERLTQELEKHSIG